MRPEFDPCDWQWRAFDRVWRSPAGTRGFSSGTLAFSYINDHLALTSVPTRNININCRTLQSLRKKSFSQRENMAWLFILKFYNSFKICCHHLQSLLSKRLTVILPYNICAFKIIIVARTHFQSLSILNLVKKFCST